jgi:hypothetical protein
MSEEKTLIQEVKDENESHNNLVSDGEIVDDDDEDVDDVKASAVTFSVKKLPKNFRARQDSEDDNNTDDNNKTGIIRKNMKQP